MLEKKFSPFWIWEKEIPPQICNYIIKQSESNGDWRSGVAGKGTKEDQDHRKNDIQWWVMKHLLVDGVMVYCLVIF